MKTAYATIKGFEVMLALRKGQAAINLTGDVRGEARIVELAFGIGTSALTGAVGLLAAKKVRSLDGRENSTSPTNRNSCNSAPTALLRQ